MTNDKITRYILDNWRTKSVPELQSETGITKSVFAEIWRELYRQDLVPKHKPYTPSQKGAFRRRMADTKKCNSTDEEVLAHIRKNWKTKSKAQIRDEMRCGHARFRKLYDSLKKSGEVTDKPKQKVHIDMSDKDLIKLHETTKLSAPDLAKSLGVSKTRLKICLQQARKNLGIVSKYSNAEAKKKKRLVFDRPEPSVLTMPWVDSKWVSNFKWRGDYGYSVY